MRLLAVVLPGDLLGVPDGFPTVEEAMQASAEAIKQILSSLECPALYIMGNDDLIDLGSSEDGLVRIHGRRFELGGFGFVGYQCGPPFMRGPFERTETELETELNALAALIDARTLLVTHYPAAGWLDAGHGLPGIRNLADRSPFLIHIHGHSHSNFGRDGLHFNVAAAGRKRAMVIDLEARTYEVIEDERRQRSLAW